MMALHSYATKAEQVCAWPSFARSALVFGVELEVEARRFSSVRAMLAALPERSNYFCKTDGSLDGGLEIVTVPGTLEWHQTTFDWPAVLAGLSDIAMSGARTQRCGMHIHINRRAMSPLTLAKMYLFINDPKHKRLIETIAQRTSSSWAQIARKRWSDARSGDAMRNAGGRYQAVNYTGPTVELRLFRGTTRPDRVLKNVEAAHAIINYCRDTSASGMRGPDFTAYVRREYNAYPHLAEFLTEMGVD